ncbi:MAG: hypothetical protein AABW90_02445 [Nanoarchaeota archaeon]
MIIDRTPISMNDVEYIIKDIQDNEKKQAVEVFLKKFLNTTSAKAKKIKDGLEKLDSIKIKREHIVKIIDLPPEDASDLNKIFTDVSLNEDEINKILEIVKNSR